MSVNQIDELKRENLCLRQEITRLQRTRLVKVIHHKEVTSGFCTIVRHAWDEYIYECS